MLFHGMIFFLLLAEFVHEQFSHLFVNKRLKRDNRINTQYKEICKIHEEKRRGNDRN